jgi:hypothetical protein
LPSQPSKEAKEEKREPSDPRHLKNTKRMKYNERLDFISRRRDFSSQLKRNCYPSSFTYLCPASATLLLDFDHADSHCHQQNKDRCADHMQRSPRACVFELAMALALLALQEDLIAALPRGGERRLGRFDLDVPCLLQLEIYFILFVQVVNFLAPANEGEELERGRPQREWQVLVQPWRKTDKEETPLAAALFL